MLTWLIVIIVAYILFGLSSLGDKLILTGPPKPNSYTFYVGAASILMVVFIPFINFGLPPGKLVFWIVVEAIVYLLGLYTMFSALKKFEVSRVITTIGATQPLFIFALTWLFWGPQSMSGKVILAFILLVFGDCLISFESGSKINSNYLKTTILASLFFSLDYIFSKIIFLEQPFLQGFIWMRIFAFFFVLLLLLSKNNRNDIFRKNNFLNKKTARILVFSQTSGAAANALQGFAISLAPIALLPIVNSLKGIQYVFLFLMTLFVSVFFPRVLREKITQKIVIRKAISMVLIVAGLALLVY
jgi:uncharacterized membrane protein